MKGLYILDENNNPVPFPINEPGDLQKWADFIQSKRAVIGEDQIGKTFIATYFIGIDRYPEKDFPVLFETVMYNKNTSRHARTSETYKEALDSHRKASGLAQIAESIRDIFKPEENGFKTE